MNPTDIDLQRAVAMTLGWTDIVTFQSNGKRGIRPGMLMGVPPGKRCRSRVPDFPTDYNTLSILWTSLEKGGRQSGFMDRLVGLTYVRGDVPGSEWRYQTASMRLQCIAFLLASGCWPEHWQVN